MAPDMIMIGDPLTFIRRFLYHAGVIAFQGPQGFWLTHSNPNFPDDPKGSTGYTGDGVAAVFSEWGKCWTQGTQEAVVTLRRHLRLRGKPPREVRADAGAAALRAELPVHDPERGRAGEGREARPDLRGTV